jgi:RimJ/RimL family protein N-acetyltransferase
VLTPSYPVRTSRLALRPYVDEDFEAALSYWSDPEVTKYLYLDAFTPEAFADRMIELKSRVDLGAEGDVLTLAIVPDGVDHVVGDMTLFWHSEVHRHGELGFILHPDHRGRGYAHEASIALLHMAFDELGLHRVTGRLDGRNAASAAVLAGLGMRREAHLVQNEWIKGEWTDEVVYALLEEEWRSRPSSS